MLKAWKRTFAALLIPGLWLLPAQAAIERLLKDNWIGVSGQHFKVFSNAEADTVRAVTEDLERFQFFLPVIAPELQINRYAPPLLVYLLKDRQSYYEINRCDICTGFFIQAPAGNYIAVSLEGYRSDPDHINNARRYLYHEYVHYAIRNATDRRHYPLWYEEGLAELFSTFLYSDKVIRVGLMREDMWLIDFDEPFPLESVLKRRDVPKNNREAARYYNYALILYRYFMSGPENRATLENYISLLNQGLSVDQAFQRTFATSYEQFALKLRTYLNLVRRAYNQPKFLYLYFKLTDRFQPPAVTSTPLTAAGRAFRLGDLLMKKYPDQLARSALLFTRALDLDRRYVPAYLGLSRYNLRQKRPYHALFYLNRAFEVVQIDETPEMLAIQGNIFLNLAVESFNQGENNWTSWAERARKSYRRALRQSPHFVPAGLGLAYYYILYDRAGRRYNRSEALKSLQRVHDTMDFATIDYYLARFLLRQGNKSRAQELLQNILIWNPDSPIAGDARILLRHPRG